VSDAIDQLTDALEQAGARVVFDRGNDHTKPCTFCGTRPAPAHELVRLGTYLNGEPMWRPVCDQCMPVALAKASPPASVVDNACAACGLQSWFPAMNVAFVEETHCLAAHLSTKPGPWADQIACKDRAIARLKERLERAKTGLRGALVAIDGAVAQASSEEANLV
jgi:hypothetical protein